MCRWRIGAAGDSIGGPTGYAVDASAVVIIPLPMHFRTDFI
jgi:hypothetical protein